MKQYNIKPIAMTNVDWVSYIKFVQDTLGFSPTRGLDEVGIKPTDTVAFFSTLELNNLPYEVLMCPVCPPMQHISVTFACELDQSDAIDLSTSIPSIVRQTPDGKYLVISTGTMKQWYDVIIYRLQPISKLDRRMFSAIYQCFLRMGFKDFWPQHSKIDKEGGFILW